MTITLDHLVALRLLEGTDVFFVQIGAFDGKSGDQIHKYVVRYGWRGIVVEPQTRPFAELQATYAGQPHLELRNVAIAERRETRTLYTVDRDATGLPEWAAQVASFDPEHLWRHGIRAIASEDVSCIPLTELLQGVERVDLLQIDVEGFDAEIIRMFDFERYRPRSSASRTLT